MSDYILDYSGTQVNSKLAEINNKQTKITASGVLKGDGAGGVSAATAGIDYAGSDIIAIQSVQPISTTNKLWIKEEQGQGVEVPTVAESLAMGISGAKVGDLVRVNSVDSNGRPTSWKRVALNEIKCNKNLLDNWYFVGGGSQQGGGQFPINQRGQTTYSGMGYGIDRWKSSAGKFVIEILSDCISIDFNQTGSPFRQICNNTVELIGKTVTFSILAKGENIRITISASNGNTFSKHFISKSFAGDANTFKIYSVTAVLENLLSTESLNAQIYSTTAESSPILCKAVKLELGSEQTLAHNEGTEESPVWVLNEIPGYQEELYKCCTSTVDSSDQYANKAVQYIEDTGWIDLTQYINTAGGFAARPGLAPAVRIINGIMYYKGEVYIKTSAGTGSQKTILDGIPSTFSPPEQISSAGVTFGDFRPFTIFTDVGTGGKGSIKISCNSYNATDDYKGFPLILLSGRSKN